jgi:hypothetical protein
VNLDDLESCVEASEKLTTAYVDLQAQCAGKAAAEGEGDAWRQDFATRHRLRKIDCINDNKRTKKNFGIVSLDIKKAFDSISHAYLNKVLEFFNFGPNLIRWLQTLGTGRQACIILEDDVLGDFFDLER